MANFPAPGPRHLLKAPCSAGILMTLEPNTETTQFGIVRLGRVAKVKLSLFSFLSLKSPGSTILFSSAIVIYCEKWPFSGRKFMSKTTLCRALTNSKSPKLVKHYTDFGII